MISYRHILTNKLKTATLAFVCASSCFLSHNLCAMQTQQQNTSTQSQPQIASSSFLERLKGLGALVFIAPADIDAYTTKGNIEEKNALVIKGPEVPEAHKADIKICFLNNQIKKIRTAKNKLDKILTNKMQLDTSYAFLYNRHKPFKGNREFNEKLYTLIEEIIFKPSKTEEKESKFFEWYKIAHRIIKNDPHMVKKIENYFVSILMNFVYLTPNNDIQTIWNQLLNNKTKKIILFFDTIKNNINTSLEPSLFYNFIELCDRINSFDISMQNDTELTLSLLNSFSRHNVNIALFLMPYILRKKKISDIQSVNLSYNSFSDIPKGIKHLPNVTMVKMIGNDKLSSLNNLKDLKIDTLDISNSNYFSFFQILRLSNKTVINGLATNFLGEIIETIGKTPPWVNLGRAGLLAFGLPTLLTLIIKNGATFATTENQFLIAYGSIITLCLFGVLFGIEGEILLSNILKSINQTIQEFKDRNDPAPPENEFLANN